MEKIQLYTVSREREREREREGSYGKIIIRQDAMGILVSFLLASSPEESHMMYIL
jgi:hypothetical protein